MHPRSKGLDRNLGTAFPMKLLASIFVVSTSMTAKSRVKRSLPVLKVPQSLLTSERNWSSCAIALTAFCNWDWTSSYSIRASSRSSIPPASSNRFLKWSITTWVPLISFSMSSMRALKPFLSLVPHNKTFLRGPDPLYS